MVAPKNVPIETAGPDLSRLVDSARHGHDVIITRAGQPVARIVPIPSASAVLKAGYGKGTVVHMAEDFDAHLTDFDEEP